SSRTTPLINAADAHVAPPSSSNAPFFELVTLGQGSMTTLASQPPHYHHHHHHYQCIRTPVICPGVYSMPAQSFFSQTASPQPHHLVEVELNVTAPRANSLATFYDHPQAPSSVVHHTANLHMTPVDQAQNSSMSSIRAEFPTQQATPTPPLTQQRLLERQQDYMSRRREAQVRWFDRQRSSQIMSNSSRYPPQYHPARGASFRSISQSSNFLPVVKLRYIS
uniref:Uncharacterized protein n=1 Tax=Romanomermis culicivorax TaxID=13658 RepID=A0A915HVR6_ROMCU